VFFKAEDGIRDRNVTGVQTCALPILTGDRAATTGPAGIRAPGGPGAVSHATARTPERRTATRTSAAISGTTGNTTTGVRTPGAARTLLAGTSSTTATRTSRVVRSEEHTSE